jgi:SAM-dependent methyltransferase
MPAATPLRRIAPSATPDIVILKDHESTYADGAEARILEIMKAADDLSSTSDELISHATDWPTRYHLDPARANIVRALDLPRNARVLEVGAGCGAVTRYIAEQVALVDALEPVPSRARVIVERTRDLDNTRVFVGHLGDVPDEPAYDVVVVIGVLEYVANGADDEHAYVEFLREVRSRLVPGGTLVLAIENQFGVKYLAGAPEDHSNRVADSMESYPYGSPARTFSRAGLLSLMEKAGLTSEARIALPDYKMTEAIIDPARLPAQFSSILGQVSEFPSPDWMPSVGRFADESLFWKSLVTAGLAAETGNSFLVLATNGDGPSVWQDDLIGAYWPVGLTAEHTHATHMRRGDSDHVELDRRGSDAPPPASGPYAAAISQAYAGAPTFVERAQAAEPQELDRLLGLWLELVAQREAAGGPVECDLVPHRLIVTDNGDIVPSPVEWHVAGHDWDMVRRRGIAYLADRLARSAKAERWPTTPTVRALATELGARAGLPADGSWLDTFVDDEATLISRVRQPSTTRSVAERQEHEHARLVAMLDRSTGHEQLLGSRLVAAEAELAAVKAKLESAEAARARLGKQVKKLKRKIAAAPTPAPRLRSRAPQWVKDLAAAARRAR